MREQVEGETLAVAGEEAPGVDGLRVVRERERVLPHEPDDVRAQPGRVAEPVERLRGRDGPDRGVVAALALGLGLAEVVQERRQAHLERRPRVGGRLDDGEDVLVERQVWRSLCCS